MFRARFHGKRVARRHALDVRLVNDRIAPQCPRPFLVPPRQSWPPPSRRVDDQHFGIPAAESRNSNDEIRHLVANDIAILCIAPSDVAMKGLGVGINQQFVGIEAMPRLRLIRPVHPVAVALTGARPGMKPWKISSVYSGSVIRACSRSPLSSNKHNSTRFAFAENSAKLTPEPSNEAPEGTEASTRRLTFCAPYRSPDQFCERLSRPSLSWHE